MAAISIRINTLLLVLLVLMAGAIIAMLASRAYGGPLDPSGPPAATDGVRGAGTPISSLPFAITTPGHYYVTRDLTGSVGNDGITVSTSNVTIDLGGFTLTGPGLGKGITTDAIRNVEILDGAVRGWETGIAALGCGYCRVVGIGALSNSNVGIEIGPQSEARDCNASLNTTTGIRGASITVRNCTIAENAAWGVYISGESSLIEGNRVNVNAGGGFPKAGIEIDGSHNMVRNNQLSGNFVQDIVLQIGSTYNVLLDNVRCTAVDNGTNNVGVGNYC